MTDYEIKSWTPDVIMERARWLGELAYANGDAKMQAGWSEYVKAKRAELEAIFPDAKKAAFTRFKELGGKIV